MALPDTIVMFLRQNPGEHHVDTIANALGIASNTASRHLADLTESATVARRRDMTNHAGQGGQRRYLYTLTAQTPTDWYDLPTWVKGSYSTDDQMRLLQSFTWVKVDDEYFAYDPEGAYVGRWGLE